MTGSQLSINNLPKVATPEAAAHIKSCLTPFKASRPKNQAELAEAISAIEYLSRPAKPEWVSGRVITLLSHYFTSQQEAAQVRAVAMDWSDMLGEYPAWAIANACRWWISHENPRKSFKPVPGEIQDRAHREMEAVRAARIMVALGPIGEEAPRREAPEAIRSQRASQAAQIIAEVSNGRS